MCEGCELFLGGDGGRKGLGLCVVVANVQAVVVVASGVWLTWSWLFVGLWRSVGSLFVSWGGIARGGDGTDVM